MRWLPLCCTPLLLLPLLDSRPADATAMAPPTISVGRIVSYHISQTIRRDAIVARIIVGGEEPELLDLRYWDPVTGLLLLAEAVFHRGNAPGVTYWDWLDAGEIAEATDLEAGNSVAQFDADSSYHEAIVTARTSGTRPLVDLVEWRESNPIGQQEVRFSSVPHREDVTLPALHWRWINE